MGISTFAHMLSAVEIEALRLVNEFDSVILALVRELNERPFLRSENDDAADEVSSSKPVDVLSTILRVLEEDDASEGTSSVRLEQKTKFWEASVSGDQVTVRYGKKNTNGQTHIHQGADAREYFEKKVREKLRTGYKDASAKKKKDAADAIRKLQNPSASGGQKRRKKGEDAAVAAAEVVQPERFRVDFDKCGALLCFVLCKMLEVELDEEYELFTALFPNTSFGSEISYGPVYAIAPGALSALSEKIAALTEQQVEHVFDTAEFPSALGGVCDVSKERDLEYCLIHFRSFKKLVEISVQQECGWLVHFW